MFDIKIVGTQEKFTKEPAQAQKVIREETMQKQARESCCVMITPDLCDRLCG